MTAITASGVKVVMATHDLGQARRLAGDVVLLVGGRICEQAPATQFFSSPTTPEAAAFVLAHLPQRFLARQPLQSVGVGTAQVRRVEQRRVVGTTGPVPAVRIAEEVRDWSYMKFPYIRSLGAETGWYRVGPLARMNVVDRIGTPLADQEWAEFRALERGPERWGVMEAAGYAADWEIVRPLLAGLAQAQVVEAKTSSPDYYDRLGVEDVDAPEAQGVMVEFSADSGVPAVILGNAARARDGQYARLAGEARSVLIDRELVLPKRREDWLDRAIVDIADDAVVEVEIHHADGERVRARRASAEEENFTLEGIAEGFEPKSDWTVNSLAGALASLRLEAVVQEGEVDWTDATVYRVVTADGLEIQAEVVAIPPIEEDEQDVGEHWLRLTAGVYTTGLDTGVAAEADDVAARERAQAINQRVQGWAYRVPEYKASSMTKRMSDLVQPVADGS